MKPAVQEMRARCDQTLLALKGALGKGAKVSATPYNLSGRPCRVALKKAENPQLLDDASIFPLDGCVSPEQCVCVYSILKLEE